MKDLNLMGDFCFIFMVFLEGETDKYVGEGK